MAWFADKLIAASGGDYTTLAAFEAAYDGESLTGTDGVRARIKGTTSDSGFVYFSGWQAGQSSSCKIVITAEAGYGIQDRTNWTGADGSGNDAILPCRLNFNEGTNALYIDFYNIEFVGDFTSTAAVNGNVYRVWNCLLRDSGYHALSFSGGTATVYIANLLIRDWSTANYQYAINCNDADITLYAWHVTCDGGYGGFYSNASATDEYRNSVIINTTGLCIYNSSVSDNYCAVDDTSANGANSIESIVVDDNFTNDDGEDYTVKDTSADIYHAGTDQPAWFDTLTGGKDIRGVSWHSTTPSIGCFEYSAAGGSISGSSAGSGSATGTLKGTGKLAGTGTAVASASAVLKGAGKLLGLAEGTSTASLYYFPSGSMTGTSYGAATVLGTLKGAGKLIGNSAGVGSLEAVLKGLGALRGVSDGYSSNTGGLKGTGNMQGLAEGSSEASLYVTIDFNPVWALWASSVIKE